MVEQITVFLDNREGRLAELCRCLGEAGVNMGALTIVENGEYGLVRLVCSDPEAARAALGEAGFSATSSRVCAIALPDRPGALGSLLARLDEQGLNVEYAYCFSAAGGRAVDVFKIKDEEAAERAAFELRAAGFEVLDQADLA